jgi:flagellar motor switch protein FliG
MSKYLEELFEKGFTTIQIKLMDGKFSAVLRNVNTETQLKIEKYASELQGGTAYVLHSYSLEMLSNTLIEYQGKEINSPEKAKEILNKLPGIILDTLIQKQQEFEKELAQEITGEELEETFFGTSPTSIDSKPEQKELTQDNQEV